MKNRKPRKLKKKLTEEKIRTYMESCFSELVKQMKAELLEYSSEIGKKLNSPPIVNQKNKMVGNLDHPLMNIGRLRANQNVSQSEAEARLRGLIKDTLEP